ncbi:hypothetical protein [Heyndrickxia coagulans]|uniref:hypothetical protein n=1 Tax=Heyndrickxia coagulans TaxID=1398 RepID=UPI002E24F2B5|nr:hypothetical protein [Heyndrickxia coagulans]
MKIVYKETSYSETVYPELVKGTPKAAEAFAIVEHAVKADYIFSLGEVLPSSAFDNSESGIQTDYKTVGTWEVEEDEFLAAAEKIKEIIAERNNRRKNRAEASEMYREMRKTFKPLGIKVWEAKDAAKTWGISVEEIDGADYPEGHFKSNGAYTFISETALTEKFGKPEK